MRKGLFALVLSSFILTSYASAYSYSSSSSNSSGQGVQLMFIQNADQAVVTKNHNKPGKFTLTLKNIDPEVAFVSDRPNRIAGKTNIQTFVNEWSNGQNSFSSDNPNAALVTRLNTSLASASQQSQEKMIVLSNPKYDSSSRTLTYDIEPVSSSITIQEGSHEEPVLFIDNNCLFLCE